MEVMQERCNMVSREGGYGLLEVLLCFISMDLKYMCRSCHPVAIAQVVEH